MAEAFWPGAILVYPINLFTGAIMKNINDLEKKKKKVLNTFLLVICLAAFAFE